MSSNYYGHVAGEIADRGGFPFPLADPVPPPVEIKNPCGCVFMEMQPGDDPVRVAWCVTHDPGYGEGDSIG